MTPPAWRAPGKPLPPPWTVHGLFERQADAAPDAPALQYEGAILTYRALEAAANRLAWRLRARGVGPGARVGVLVERSAELMAAVLGVLKAGAAYVPLDPAAPAERRAFILADAEARLLVTHGPLAAEAQAPGVEALRLDGPEGASFPEERPPPAASGGDPAYLIYTSGSTGQPKGVVVRHQSVANLVGSMAERPGLTAADALAAVAPLSFDMAVCDLFLPLAAGARVVLISRAEATDGERLARRLEEAGATLFEATPSTWQLLVTAGFRRGRLRAAWVGGEALSRELANQLLERGLPLWNLYGPTETTVWSASGEVRREGPVALEAPLWNTELHLLGPDGRPAPDGEVGEICIGGAGLALGYHRRPELTASRFVPDPFSGREGARLYRTGDLGRRLPDGRLECLGRADHQVKVRGYRVELGEIEAALLRLPAVGQAVVEARPAPHQSRRLVGYVVPRDPGFPPPAEALKAALQATLPEYMIPSAFVTLDRMPLSPNGKVLRSALPEPPAAAGPDDLASELERALAQVWAKVLRVERVGRDQNFFELGGDSILALQAAGRSKKAGVGFTVKQLRQHPTIAGLAAAVERDRARPEAAP